MNPNTNISNAPEYSIGQAAKQLGISTHSLRVYEKQGLILPHRTSSGRRVYSELEILKIKSIMELIREEGLNFAAIRRLMALVPCWEIRGEDYDKCVECPVLQEDSKPCWSDPDNCMHSDQQCRECPVYVNTVSLKTLKIDHFLATKTTRLPK
jgi:MerR family transcriptional regulator, heat shock protein HspR